MDSATQSPPSLAEVPAAAEVGELERRAVPGSHEASGCVSTSEVLAGKAKEAEGASEGQAGVQLWGGL